MVRPARFCLANGMWRQWNAYNRVELWRTRRELSRFRAAVTVKVN